MLWIVVVAGEASFILGNSTTNENYLTTTSTCHTANKSEWSSIKVTSTWNEENDDTRWIELILSLHSMLSRTEVFILARYRGVHDLIGGGGSETVISK